MLRDTPERESDVLDDALGSTSSRFDYLNM